MLTLLPWFGFSLSTSGSLLPNSRRAVAHLQDFEHPWTSLSEAPARLMEQLRSGMWWSADLANFFGLSPLVDPSGKLYLYPPFILMVALAVLVLGFLVYRQHASIQIAAPILAYAFIHGGYYLLAHRIEFRYMLPSSALALVAVAALVHAGTERRPRDGTRLALAGVLAIALTFSLTSGILAFQRGYGSHRAHRYQIVAHRAAQWLKTTYPEAVVASFNAGVLSYFSQTELVNLDGVINDEALEAIEHKRLGQYILERRVALLVEEPGQLALNLERFSDSRMLAGRLGPVIETFEDDAQRVIIVQRVLYPEFDSVEGVEAASGDAESSRVSGSAHSPEVTREP
jgi:hypothetical protein